MTINAVPPVACVLEATLSVGLSPYTAGVLIGTPPAGNGQNSSPITMLTPWPGGTAFIIQNVWLVDENKQNAAIDVVFFNSFPAKTTFTDNVAFDVDDGDMDKLIGGGAVNIVSYDSFADDSVGKAQNLAIVGVLPGTTMAPSAASLYACLVSRGTPTYAATDDLRLRVALIQL